MPKLLRASRLSLRRHACNQLPLRCGLIPEVVRAVQVVLQSKRGWAEVVRGRVQRGTSWPLPRGQSHPVPCSVPPRIAISPSSTTCTTRTLQRRVVLRVRASSVKQLSERRSPAAKHTPPTLSTWGDDVAHSGHAGVHRCLSPAVPNSRKTVVSLPGRSSPKR